MNRYKEAERGRFDCFLIDRWRNVAVAFTDYDTVKLTKDYKGENRNAVEEFAEGYGFPVDWEHRH